MSNLLLMEAERLMASRRCGDIGTPFMADMMAQNILDRATPEQRAALLEMLLPVLLFPTGTRLPEWDRGGGPVDPPKGPPEPPPAPVKPVEVVKAEAPLPPPLVYTDHLLVTQVIYLLGKLLANHEVARGKATFRSEMRCRSYQLLVRQYHHPDGTSSMGLLRSNDPLVQPELLRQKNAPEQALARGNSIVDVPVEAARDSLPYVVIGGRDETRGIHRWGSTDSEFEMLAESMLNLAESSDRSLHPELATWVFDGDEQPSDEQRTCFNSREPQKIRWATPRRCSYLEPQWPGNGMPGSREDFNRFMTGLEKAHWDGWCFRYLTSPTVTVPKGQQLNVSVLGSPRQAAAVRQAGAKVAVNLVPLSTMDGRRLLDVNGVPKNTHTVDGPNGPQKVHDRSWEKWLQTRAVEATGAVMQCR